MRKKLLVLSLVLCAAKPALANEWSAGGGLGLSVPIFSNNFNELAGPSLMGGIWGRNDGMFPVGVELGYDMLDFSDVPTKAHYFGGGALFRFLEEDRLRPHFLAGLGLGRGDSRTRIALKLRAGADYLLENGISVGGYLNYHLFPGRSDSHVMHVLSPMVGVTYAFGAAEAGESEPDAAYRGSEELDSELDEVVAATPVQRPQPIPEEFVVVDSDGDGIPDADDRCPNTAKGRKVNVFGCPVEDKAEIRLAVTFAPYSSQVSAESRGEIERVAAFLKARPSVRVTVEGHTDTSGNPVQNWKISEARAKSVRDALVAAGANPSQMSAKGFGSERPVASNDTPEGRAQNRRVVLTVD